MRQIAGFEEPIAVLDMFEDRGLSGMSHNDLAFLCGVIKEYRPCKIVEIGVAAGVTTAVILSCLKMLDYECEMYSVDIDNCYYKDPSELTGFYAQRYLATAKLDKVRHKFLLGNTIAKFVKEIGDEIDLVIIDTMHALPGELLDFISVIRHLNKKCIAVFHDIGQCQHSFNNPYGSPFEIASLATICATVGEKLIMDNHNNISDFPNIGGVELSDNVEEFLDNLFLSLFLPWNYIPQENIMEEYTQCIKNEFGEEYVNIVERAEEINIFSLYRRNGIKVGWNRIKEQLKEAATLKRKFYVYGHGNISSTITNYIETEILKGAVEGYIVSDGQDKTDNTYWVSEFSKEVDINDCIIILALDEIHHSEIVYNMKKYGLNRLLFPYNGVGFREMLEGIMFEQESMRDGIVNKNAYENLVMKAYSKR